jgi:hypothetical protein
MERRYGRACRRHVVAGKGEVMARVGRLVRLGLASALATMALAVAASAPASAVPVGGGGGDDDPCNGITGTLTEFGETTPLGVSVWAFGHPALIPVQWTVDRPQNCGGVVSELTGPGTATFGGVGGADNLLVSSVPGTYTYTVTAFVPGGTRVVASGFIQVVP